MKQLFSIFIFLLLSSTSLFSQKNYQIKTVAFYNLENLFDTINDPSKNDEASPMMEIKENRSFIYQKKLNNMAKVLSELGTKEAKQRKI